MAFRKGSGVGILATATCLCGAPLLAQTMPGLCRTDNPSGMSAAIATPLLGAGPPGSWSSGGVQQPSVWRSADGSYGMSLIGRDGTGRTAVGFARSSDGLRWIQEGRLPAVTPQDLGLAEGWTIYEVVPFPPPERGTAFMVVSRGPDRTSFRYQRIEWNGRSLGTPEELSGLNPGPEGSWDESFSVPRSMVRTGNRLVLFFDGSEWVNWAIGRAESTDGGANWVKFDDPTTTSSRFNQSDPVFRSASADTEIDHIFVGDVTITEDGWRMLYTGGPDPRSPIPFAVGEAYSYDQGRTWHPGDEPLIAAVDTAVMSHPTSIEIDGEEYVVFSMEAREDFRPLGVYAACRSARNPPVPSVSDLSWMEGVWSGSGPTGFDLETRATSILTAPIEGVLSWTFGWHTPENNHVHYAFHVLQDTGGGTILRGIHFAPSFTHYEDVPWQFRLTSARERWARFECITATSSSEFGLCNRRICRGITLRERGKS